jgi:hypothetical protein
MAIYKTVIEKGQDGDVLVILGTGAVVFAADAADANRQILQWEARHVGGVANEREWRGFTKTEVELALSH